MKLVSAVNEQAIRLREGHESMRYHGYASSHLWQDAFQNYHRPNGSYLAFVTVSAFSLRAGYVAYELFG